MSVWVLCRSSVSTPSAVTGWPGYRPSTTASRKLSGTTRCPPRGLPGERERDTGVFCPSCVPHCRLTALCMAQLVCYPLLAIVGLLPPSCHCWFVTLFLPLLVCYPLLATVGLLPSSCHCWLVTLFLPLLACYPVLAIVGLLPPFCHC